MSKATLTNSFMCFFTFASTNYYEMDLKEKKLKEVRKVVHPPDAKKNKENCSVLQSPPKGQSSAGAEPSGKVEDTSKMEEANAGSGLGIHTDTGGEALSEPTGSSNKTTNSLEFSNFSAEFLGFSGTAREEPTEDSIAGLIRDIRTGNVEHNEETNPVKETSFNKTPEELKEAQRVRRRKAKYNKKLAKTFGRINLEDGDPSTSGRSALGGDKRPRAMLTPEQKTQEDAKRRCPGSTNSEQNQGNNTADEDMAKKGIVLRVITIEGSVPSAEDVEDIETELFDKQMLPGCPIVRIDSLQRTAAGMEVVARDTQTATWVTDAIHGLKDPQGAQRFEAVYSYQMQNCFRYFVSVERRIASNPQQFCNRLKVCNPAGLHVSKIHVKSFWEAKPTPEETRRPQTCFVVWVEQDVEKYLKANSHLVYFGIGKVKFVPAKK